MLLKSKEVAFTGIMMAIGVFLVTFGGYLESSTLFFLAAASFLTGVVWRCLSAKAALLFVIGTTVLGLLLAPQKLYLATFFAFCVYILVAECLEQREKGRSRKGIWAIKAVLYHALLGISLFLVIKFLGLEVLFDGRLFEQFGKYRLILVVPVLLAAELLWILFDRAYFYFQERYAGVFRRLL